MRHCLFLFSLLVFSALSAQNKTELFVLAVGVETYNDTRLVGLNYCADDARDVAAAFKKQNLLYDVMEVKVLTDAQATRSALRSELDRFSKMVTEDDLFIFFYSGHGVEKGLVPFDFDYRDPYATLLNQDDLKNKLIKMGCNYMVLIDACYSGSFAKSALSKELPGDDAFLLSVDRASRQLLEALGGVEKKSLIITSSSSDQRSWECVSCGHGYFAQAILDCFDGKSLKDPNLTRTIKPRADENGFLNVQGFKTYISEAVRIRTMDLESQQQVQGSAKIALDLNILIIKNGAAASRTTARSPSGTPKPDKDYDGIPDATDECPTDYGTLRGCPDSDEDGIADKFDQCPFEAGPAGSKGCPTRDRDSDGVADVVDECPDKIGEKKWQGCPDTDSDGIPDHRDACPATPGTTLNNGCSEKDKPEIFKDPLVGTFVYVKGGSFDMGMDKGKDVVVTKPVRRVTVGDYYMGQTEVTQAQWKAVMGNNPSSNASCDQCPVEQVSWRDVQEFLQKLNSKGGRMLYRLPTEAEWEYAARGGIRSRGFVYAGSNVPSDVAWYNFNAENQSQPVRSKQANELGLYDMSGNVWEWCSDAYADVVDFNESEKVPERVYRGGSWYYSSRYNRIPFRNYGSENGKAGEIGFRLVITVY